MEPKIRRKFKSFGITLTTATGSATTLRFDDIAGGVLLMGTVNTNSTAIQLWVSDTTATSGTWGRLRDSSGSAADITLSPSSVTPTAYALPDAVYGCGAIRLVSSGTNSTAAVCTVLLKT